MGENADGLVTRPATAADMPAVHALGQPVVRLHVERENVTGALGLYEAVGMRTAGATQLWTRGVSSG